MQQVVEMLADNTGLTYVFIVQIALVAIEILACFDKYVLLVVYRYSVHN